MKARKKPVRDNYMTIEEALEKEITRGNCETCKRNNNGFCDVTEEEIGSGDEYCELSL